MTSKEHYEKIIDDALAVRQLGNDKFKSGDLIGALRDYHTVILSLRGLDGKMQTFFGPQYTPEPVLPRPKISEISGDKKHDGEMGQPDKKESPYAVIKSALLNTHINSAAIHIKQEHWQRALECAQAAQKIDEKNSKASFREAQARIGLGQIAKGKAILEEMQRNLGPDPGITRTLAQLEVQEKEKEKTRTEAFRGMFLRNKSMTSTAGSDSTSSVRAQVGGSETGSSSATLATPVTDATATASASSRQADRPASVAVQTKSDQVSKEAEAVTQQVKDEVSAKQI